MNKNIIWVLGLFVVLCLVGSSSAYEYAGFDSLIKDVNDYFSNPANDTLPSLVESQPPTTSSLPVSGTFNQTSPSTVEVPAEGNSAPQSPATSSPDADVVGSVKLDGRDYYPDDFFTVLDFNTEEPCTTCEGVFDVRNPLGTDLPLNNLLNLDFIDESGERNPSIVTSLDVYMVRDDCVQLSSMTLDCSEKLIPVESADAINAGETAKIKIVGRKAFTVQVDWKPYLRYVEPQTEEMIKLRQDRWAIWKKGPISIGNSNLIAGYHLDESSGAVLDFSGNGRNCVSVGATRGQVGIFGTAYKFDGSGDKINTTSTGFDLKNSGSVSVWFKYHGQSTAQYPVLVGKGAKAGYDTSGWSIWTRADTGQIICSLTNTTSSEAKSVGTLESTLALNKIYHIVCVWNQTDLVLYINGTQVSANTHTAKTPGYTTDRFSIGQADQTAQTINGTVDEVQVYGDALTASNVIDLYEAGITQVNVTSPLDGNTVDSPVGVSAVVGFGDNSSMNITLQNVSGQWVYLMDQSGYFGNSHEYASRLNATHWGVTANYTLDGNPYNITVSAYGGNGLITGSSKTVSFTVGTTTTTTTVPPVYSNIISRTGGIRILPLNQKLVLNVSGITMLNSDGSYSCCGPVNNQWTCTGGVC